MKQTLDKLFKLWSVKLAMAAGVLVTLIGNYIVQDPTVVPRLVALVPEPYAKLAVIVGGFAAFAVPTLLRGLPQPKLREDEKL